MRSQVDCMRCSAYSCENYRHHNKSNSKNTMRCFLLHEKVLLLRHLHSASQVIPLPQCARWASTVRTEMPFAGAWKQLQWRSGCRQAPKDCFWRTDQQRQKPGSHMGWGGDVIRAVDFAQRCTDEEQRWRSRDVDITCDGQNQPSSWQQLLTEF